MWVLMLVFFQAEDGIRDLVRSRGLGDVYKRQLPIQSLFPMALFSPAPMLSMAETQIRDTMISVMVQEMMPVVLEVA